jgi:hypothetical protein
MRGISFTIFPTSWAFGPWNLPHKWLFAIGPFRFVYHKHVQGEYGGQVSAARRQREAADF